MDGLLDASQLPNEDGDGSDMGSSDDEELEDNEYSNICTWSCFIFFTF